MIDLPIYVIDLEGDILKYNSIEFAENDLEAYDISHYRVFDSSYRQLELYKKDKYHRVGFKISDDKKTYHDELLNFVNIFFNDILEIKVDTELKDLLNKIQPEDPIV